MSSRANLWRTLIFVLFIGPGPVIGVVPYWLSGWHLATPIAPWRYLGLPMMAVGLIPLADSIVRFLREGHGTLDPVHPTETLVVTGFYRYVRNPMYLGVLLMVFGQAIFLANWRIAVYGACCALIVHFFVVGYEERVLHAKYGQQYEDFCHDVGRWIPRLTPRSSSSA